MDRLADTRDGRDGLEEKAVDRPSTRPLPEILDHYRTNWLTVRVDLTLIVNHESRCPDRFVFTKSPRAGALIATVRFKRVSRAL